MKFYEETINLREKMELRLPCYYYFPMEMNYWKEYKTI